jgi:hypothetical protein
MVLIPRANLFLTNRSPKYAGTYSLNEQDQLEGSSTLPDFSSKKNAPANRKKDFHVSLLRKIRGSIRGIYFSKSLRA